MSALARLLGVTSEIGRLSVQRLLHFCAVRLFSVSLLLLLLLPLLIVFPLAPLLSSLLFVELLGPLCVLRKELLSFVRSRYFFLLNHRSSLCVRRPVRVLFCVSALFSSVLSPLLCPSVLLVGVLRFPVGASVLLRLLPLLLRWRLHLFAACSGSVVVPSSSGLSRRVPPSEGRLLFPVGVLLRLLSLQSYRSNPLFSLVVSWVMSRSLLLGLIPLLYFPIGPQVRGLLDLTLAISPSPSLLMSRGSGVSLLSTLLLLFSLMGSNLELFYRVPIPLLSLLLSPELGPFPAVVSPSPPLGARIKYRLWSLLFSKNPLPVVAQVLLVYLFRSSVGVPRTFLDLSLIELMPLLPRGPFTVVVPLDVL